jgi:TRAP-type transport system small permease protein
VYRRIEFLCAVFLLSTIVILVGIGSITRYLGMPVIGLIEISQMLFIWLCMIAADLALQNARHFGLGFMAGRLSEKGGRLLRIGNLVIVAGLLVFLFIYSIVLTRISHPRLIGGLQMHYSFITAALCLGMALMIRTTLAQLIAEVRDWKSGRRPAEPPC